LVVLVVDNTSPYAADILACLDQLDISYLYRRFGEVSYSDIIRCGSVILSGRRKYDKSINMVNSRIANYCHNNYKPLLGICYGAQIIALTFGGSIYKMPTNVHGMTVISVSDQNSLVGDKQSMVVYESHRYCIAKLPSDFRSIASSKYCKYEVFLNERGIYGIQFHPEKSGRDGLALLKNFTKI
jgi:GMP synthase (glutamine-hydrolysing)